MRRRRRSWLLTVHRWLFRLSLVVVIGSALSRIDGEGADFGRRSPAAPRDAALRQEDDRLRAAIEDDTDDEQPSLFALAGCP